MVRKLTGTELARIRRTARKWEGTLPPCRISRGDIFCPCLPEEFDGRLECVTCGLKQVLEIER